MKENLSPGLIHKKTVVVTSDMGVQHFGAGAPSVFSTPSMIAVMERACVELLTPYLDEGEQTVGFHVDVKHLAPTRIGQSVTITATLQEVKEKRFRFAVEAINDQGVKIGEGTHRRALVNLKQFTSSS
ncbi:MAG: thioesterase family protein [Deltaproteobacteria bacterium]|nr:thioesterase family protein [Deltaproteobacteria bacterium]